MPDGMQTAILKLFDRRFGEFRKQHPYNQQAEAAWQDSVRSGLAKRLLDDLRNDEDSVRRARFQKDVDEEGSEEEEEDEDDDEDADDDDNENDLAEWEAIIYHTAQTNYENEVRAYSQLKPLQGRCTTPRFIESVIDSSPESPADLPVEYFQVPGILLEYIYGFPLSELTTRIPNQPFVWEKIVEGAIDVVREVNRAGVVHHDCQPRNMLVAEKGHGAFQLYLIDFAQCAFRADYKDTDDLYDEDGFAHIVTLYDNHGGIAILMSRRVKRETSYTLRLKALHGACDGNE
ncbi:Protein kinase-like domain protein, partial [Metarhizium majus ARSEF 297]